MNELPLMSEKCDVVLSQLIKAKKEMGSAVKKDASNPFHKSKYASLGSYLDASEEVLAELGLLMLQCPNLINGEHVLVSTLHHPESGQWIKSYLPLHNPKGDSQGIGSAITYMRRYSISSMLGLNAEDDDGEAACGRGKRIKEEAAPTKEEKAPPVQFKIAPTLQNNFMMAMARIKGTDLHANISGWMKKKYNSDSAANLTEGDYNQLMERITQQTKEKVA